MQLRGGGGRFGDVLLVTWVLVVVLWLWDRFGVCVVLVAVLWYLSWCCLGNGGEVVLSMVAVFVLRAVYSGVGVGFNSCVVVVSVW